MRLTRRKKDEILSWIRAILDSIPDDRSCHTCSHFCPERTAHCMRWGEVVPDENQDAGCPEWTDQEEVPF